jgi:hypothetical protein
MSRLSEDQLQLLDVLNRIRLTLTNEFKNHSNPSPSVFFKELMRLEVVLMENKNKEDLDRLMNENHGNLDVLMNQLMIKPVQ